MKRPFANSTNGRDCVKREFAWDFLVSVRVISWIGQSREHTDDPRNHTNLHEQELNGLSLTRSLPSVVFGSGYWFILVWKAKRPGFVGLSLGFAA
jgi:hypothetical protein